MIFVASLAFPSPEKKEMEKTFLLVTLVVASASASLPYLFRGCFWREGEVKYGKYELCAYVRICEGRNARRHLIMEERIERCFPRKKKTKSCSVLCTAVAIYFAHERRMENE